METSTIVKYTRISHHFRFNYSETNEIREGEFVSSPIFRALNHDWVVDCYPRGSAQDNNDTAQDNNDNVSFFVRPQVESQNLVANFMFGLMRTDQTMSEFEVPVSPSEGCKFGLPNMVSRALLESNYIKDACFEFICTVNCLDEAESSTEVLCLIKGEDYQPIYKTYTNSTAVKYFRISNHFQFESKIKDLGQGQFVSSPLFKAFSHEWVVDCYPHGTLSSGDSCFSFYVRQIQGEPLNISPNFTFSLVRDKRIIDYSVPSDPIQGHGFGCSTISSFMPPDFELFGYFEFICGVNNIEEAKVHKEASKKCFIGVSPFDLHTQLGEILKKGEMTDVTFEVDDQTFDAHKFILAARSSVFKAELFGQMAEAKQQRIKIFDIKPDVFRAMLNYIYTDLLPDSDDTDNSKITLTIMAQHLYDAADRYAIEGLRILSEDLLCRNITLETVASTLTLAEQHDSTKLKAACFKFMNKPGVLECLIYNEDYTDMVQCFPSLLVEIRNKVNNARYLKDLKIK